MTRISWLRLPLGAAALATLGLGMCPAAHAVVLYAENFEAAPLSSTTEGPSGFVQEVVAGWEVQGGGGAGGVSLTTGVDTNGAGGSQGLFAIWDHTPAAPGFFTFNQYTVYGLPAPGAGVTANQVKVSMDVLIDGSSTNNPLDIVYQSGGDKAFNPVLNNGVYTPVSFTLDQTGGPAFNPIAGFNLRIQHGAGGFGFDANNVVRVDNVRVEVIPEPSTLALAGAGVAAAMFTRRRRAAV